MTEYTGHNHEFTGPWQQPGSPHLDRLTGEPHIGAESDIAPNEDTSYADYYPDYGEQNGTQHPPYRAEAAAGSATVGDVVDERLLPATRPSHFPMPVQGEVVPFDQEYNLGGPHEPVRGDPTRPFTAEIRDDPHVVITGGNAEKRAAVTDRVVNELARKFAEELPDGETAVIVRARFSGGGDPEDLAASVDSSVATAIELPVTDARGGPCLVNNLTKSQLAEALGSAIAGEDSRAAGAYAEIIEAATDGIDKWIKQQQELQQAGIIDDAPVARTLTHLQWAVDQYRDKGSDQETDTGEIIEGLGEDGIHAVMDALALKRQQALRQYFEPLGAGLSKMIKDIDSDRDPRHAVVPPDGLTGDNRVAVLGVTVTGIGRRMAGEKDILVNALLPLAGAETPLGRPRAVVIEGADYVNPAALDELERHCLEKRPPIPVVYTVVKPTERNANLLEGDTHIILRAPTRAADLVSKACGTRPGPEVTGVSESITGGASTGAHVGKNFGWRDTKAGERPETGGWTSSIDDGVNVGHTYSETIAFEGPVLKPVEITGLGEDDVVVRRGQEVAGVYDINSKGLVAPYPPPRRKPSLDAQAKIDQINRQNDAAKFLARKVDDLRAEVEQLRTGSAQPQPAIGASPPTSAREFLNLDESGLPVVASRPSELARGPEVRPDAQEQHREMQFGFDYGHLLKPGKHRDYYRQWQAVRITWEQIPERERPSWQEYLPANLATHQQTINNLNRRRRL